MIITLFVILFSSLAESSTALIGAFITGVFVDIWQGRTIGVSSISFLCISFLLNIYKRKFNPQHLVFLLPFTMIVIVAEIYFTNNSIISKEFLIVHLLNAGAGIIILWSLVRLWHYRFGKSGQSA